eukprot:TRINITY_DN779793_c0_g1_i1.p1 TRINITY_DN779793_c0_g1~~TRINITY_DN779793_c0_g1_i1.p1  ORF type:complete len:187 (-),score=45.15 TRINITY_DN779793_c0_g1_i1:817-1377(-)
MGGIKIVLLGTAGVGKSSLAVRCVSGNFLNLYDPTVEDVFEKELTVDKQTEHFEISDTAGQELGSMQEVWIGQGTGFMLVCSLTDQESFRELSVFHDRILEIKNKMTGEVPCILVGNMKDLEHRKVSSEEFQAFASSLQCLCFEVSMKNSPDEADECFKQIIREVRKSMVVSKPNRKKSKNSCTLL